MTQGVLLASTKYPNPTQPDCYGVGWVGLVLRTIIDWVGLGWVGLEISQLNEIGLS
jgi:hypothetical protein